MRQTQHSMLLIFLLATYFFSLSRTNASLWPFTTTQHQKQQQQQQPHDPPPQLLLSPLPSIAATSSSDLRSLFSLRPSIDVQLSEGKRQLALLDSRHHSSSDNSENAVAVHTACNEDASLERLYAHCQQYSDGSISSSSSSSSSSSKDRIAIALANCHLAKSDLPIHRCAATASIERCRSAIGKDSRAFAVYTTFSTRVEDICLYLQRDAQQSHTANTIVQLLSATHTTTQQLHELATDAETLTAALADAVQSSSSDLRTVVTTVAEQQQRQLQVLLLHSESLSKAQQQLLSTLNSEAGAITTQLQHAAAAQSELSLTAASTAADAKSISNHQQQMQHTLTSTAATVTQLHHDHTAAAEQAMQSLTLLHSGHAQIQQQQQEAKQALHALSDSQRQAFDDAQQLLVMLSAEQQQQLSEAAVLLSTLVTGQQLLKQEAQQLSLSVADSRQSLQQLHAAQHSAFSDATKQMTQLQQQAAATEQMMSEAFADVLGSLSSLLAMDATILAGLLSAASVLFYSAVAAVCFLLTSTKQTADTRPMLLLLVAASAASEGHISTYLLPLWPAVAAVSATAATDLHLWLVACYRVLLLSSIVMLLVYSTATHQDYQKAACTAYTAHAVILAEHQRLLQLLTQHYQMQQPTNISNTSSGSQHSKISTQLGIDHFFNSSRHKIVNIKNQK